MAQSQYLSTDPNAGTPVKAREVTTLTPAQERTFLQWISENKITDLDHPKSFYDYRGYWKDVASKGVDQRKQYDDGLHFPDTYKQHGHPTFSVESKYSAGPDDGGRWNGETYVPQASGYLSTDPNEGQPQTTQAQSMRDRVEAAKAKWSERMGLNQPTDSRLTGFLRGAGAGAVDLAQGAVSSVVGQLNEKTRGENAAMADMRQMFGTPTGIAVPEQTELAPVEQPNNFSGSVGSVLPAVAEMAAGGTPVARSAVAAIPSATRAGEKFQQVMSAARNIPIPTQEVGDAALRIQQLAERGGSMPMAVRKLLGRMTDPEKGALVYEEARDFASNISRLSANEFGRLTPAVAREVANLRVVLNKANAAAAKQAGKLEEYNAAMIEYAKAMRLQSAVNSAIKGAKKALPIAGAAGAGAWLTQRVRDALGQ